MRAIALTEFGGNDRLELTQVDDPKVGPDFVLIRVRGAGLNPVDWKIREGSLESRFPHIFPVVPGWEAAGVVEEVGPAVTGLARGDEVFAYCRKHFVGEGTYAEYVSVPEDFVSRKPEALDFVHAGAVPLAGLTAFQALVEATAVRAGETVLVQGAAGGVGAFAVQLARARGAQVIGTATSAKHEFLRDLGTTEEIDYSQVDFVEAVRESRAEGIDVVFDLFGGETLWRSVDVIAHGGRIVSLADPLTDDHYRQRGITPAYIFVRPSGSQLAELARLIDGGEMRVELEASYPLDDAAQALERLESGRVRGKLALEVG
jgi:NADPH:quinone reductase-like Zn-dependent oxidoreductase